MTSAGADGERLCIRRPGDTGFALGPHLDSRSVDRFEDEAYRACYEAVLAGRWEDHDAWDAQHRAVANPAFAKPSDEPNGNATVFRAFQGWLAVSQIGPPSGGAGPRARCGSCRCCARPSRA